MWWRCFIVVCELFCCNFSCSRNEEYFVENRLLGWSNQERHEIARYSLLLLCAIIKSGFYKKNWVLDYHPCDTGVLLLYVNCSAVILLTLEKKKKLTEITSLVGPTKKGMGHQNRATSKSCIVQEHSSFLLEEHKQLPHFFGSTALI